jgi:hypothetical protein
MKITFATCMVLLILSVSCKKSTEQPDLNCTTNPPVNKADNAYNATYYYYNQSGQVSLEKGFYTSTGDPGYETTINYYYTGANLDSTVSFNLSDGMIYTSYYSGGNCTVSKIHTAAQEEITTLTYSKIPTGGLCFIYGNAQLISGTTDVTIPATSTFTSTYTYQLDAANRVVVGLLSKGVLPAQKHVFTYY